MKSKNFPLLALALLFLFFSNGRWSFPLATWAYPLCMLLITRDLKLKNTHIYIPLLTGLCLQASFWNFTFQDPINFLFYIPFMGGVVFGLIFCADRLVYHRLSGLKATLFFPALYTTVDFLNNLFNPFGTTGVLGYTQFDFLAFSQLASLTGMWGLTFMITWFGSVIYWVFEHYENLKFVKKGALIFAIVFMAILTYGSIRLVLPLENGTVRVAGIHTSDRTFDKEKLYKFLAKKDTLTFKKNSQIQLAELIKITRQEANAGAKIVLWSEGSNSILLSQQDSLVKVLKTVSKEHKIYLMATPYAVSVDENKPVNKVMIFTPEGTMKLEHFKFGGNFMEGSVEGNKQIKALKTPSGTISSIICWDADFPSVITQVGKLQADILFIPGSDWKEIDPLHTQVAVFRGIENGCSVVRQTREGLSIMTDPRGKTVAYMNHFTSNSWVNVGQVPNHHLWTLYPIIGDLFGWLAIIGLCVLLWLAFGRK
jgi:apolipoprotein N-acyltransferase